MTLLQPPPDRLGSIAINDSKSAAHGYSPFFVDEGRPMRWPIDRVLVREGDKELEPDLRDWIHKHAEVQRAAAIALAHSRAQLRSYFNPRHDSPLSRQIPSYKKGDMVYLHRRNLSHPDLGIRPHSKWSYQWAGPYAVVDMPTPVSVRLKLPSTWRIHDTFHVASVKPAYGNDRFQELRPRRPKTKPNKNDEWEVERVLDHRVGRTGTQVYVKWTGWDTGTWEPIEELKDNVAFDRYLKEEELEFDEESGTILASTGGDLIEPSFVTLDPLPEVEEGSAEKKGTTRTKKEKSSSVRMTRGSDIADAVGRPPTAFASQHPRLNFLNSLTKYLTFELYRLILGYSYIRVILRGSGSSRIRVSGMSSVGWHGRDTTEGMWTQSLAPSLTPGQGLRFC